MVSFTFCHVLFDGESNSPIFRHSRRTAQVLLVAWRVQSDSAVTWRNSKDLCLLCWLIYFHSLQGCFIACHMIWHILRNYDSMSCFFFQPSQIYTSKSAINVLYFCMEGKHWCISQPVNSRNTNSTSQKGSIFALKTCLCLAQNAVWHHQPDIALIPAMNKQHIT